MGRMSLSILHHGLIVAGGLVPWTLASPARLSTSDLAPTVSVSVTPSFVSDTPKNTHTSTTGQDGKTTSVPIVGGPECWFCPNKRDETDTTGGWALLGIDSPGVYQPLSSELVDPIPIITVSSNGDPTYAPSRTNSETPTKAKREDVPTTTTTVTSQRFQKLQEASPGTKEWVVGSAHGLRLKTMTKWNGIPVPKHYYLIAGHITVTIETGPVHYVKCGKKLIKYDETHSIDFTANSYDIEAPVVEGQPREISFREHVDPGAWYQISGAFYKYLGKMKEEVTADEIKQKGIDLANTMNEEGYSTLFNNCGTFSRRLWKMIKA